ncbi:hypothetical protein BKA63DRAFT_500951 [Paraphoma chrysanthemicola]|nr:hypothetical protein BKA63DRAFT_500951 [Paraphoma chrysanthemicola]
MTNDLAPPRIVTDDPGAKELDDASSDEHFSDASEGQTSRNEATSPIPITRVERVDDDPAYGEVPGTDAYKKRTQDAVPDEVEIVPEGARSRSASRVSSSDRPLTPGGTPVPKTVVEKIDPSQPSYGDVPGTLAHQQRLADAEPDIIVKAPEPPQRKPEGSPTASNRSSISPHDGATESSLDAPHAPQEEDDENDDFPADDDGFGDFDEFEEGGEGDDDFGDFDDGFQQGEEQAETSFDKPPDQPPVPAPSPGPPVLNFEDLESLEDIISATHPYINEIYPSLQEIPSITATEDARSIFLTERSKSLWTQLVAPPPLQPPDWVRSRIRRMFLVSLGVPVDLDEILPASKQKKLILPSIHIPGEKSPRPSSDGRNGALGRVKREGENASTTSVDSSASKPNQKRKGPPPPPELDISSTTMLCATTDAALQNFTKEELEAHVEKLKGLQIKANEVFEYWQKRMESALGDKDAFEQVIESLVAHAKKLR